MIRVFRLAEELGLPVHVVRDLLQDAGQEISNRYVFVSNELAAEVRQWVQEAPQEILTQLGQEAEAEQMDATSRLVRSAVGTPGPWTSASPFQTPAPPPQPAAAPDRGEPATNGEATSRLRLDRQPGSQRAEWGLSQRDAPRSLDRAAPHAELLTVLRQYRVSVAVSLVLTLLVAYALSGQTTRSFVAETSVILDPLPEPDGSRPVVNVAVQQALVESGVLAATVAGRLGDAEIAEDPQALLNRLSVSADAEVETLTFEYRGESRAAAVEGAQAVVDAYLEFRSGQAQQTLDEIVAEARADLERLSAERAELVAALLLAGEEEAVALRNRLNTVLNEQAAAQEALFDYEGLDPQVGEVLVAPAVLGGALGLSQPMVLLLGLLLGLVLGVSQASMRSRLDDRVRDPVMLERLLEAPELAVMPRTTPIWKRGVPPLVGRDRPSSPAAGAYRVLGVGLLAQLRSIDARTVVVAGHREGDGATTTVVNLAHAMTQMGERVAVVSADLHAPTLHQHLGVEEGPGLVDILAGRTTLADVNLSSGIERLSFLRTGTPKLRRAGVLARTPLTELLKKVEDTVDVVLVDAAPLSSASDAAELASVVSLVVLVIDHGGLDPEEARRVLRPVRNARAEILGFVRNQARLSGLR